MKSIILFSIVKYLGVIYLVYLGVRMIIIKMSSSQTVSIMNEGKLSRVYVQGILTNLFNPKVALFYIAFLPQFVSSNSYGAIPFIILGFTFIVTGTIWCLVITLFSSYVTKRLRDNSRTEWILKKITGVVFVSMGLGLLDVKVK